MRGRCPYCGRVPSRMLRHLKSHHGITKLNKHSRPIPLLYEIDSIPKDEYLETLDNVRLGMVALENSRPQRILIRVVAKR